MPVYSMTGYASGQHSPAGSHPEGEARPHGTARLGVEIRSVNSRFLDLSFKLPEELRQHEPALRDMLTAQLKRGKVELRAAIDNTAAAGIGDPSTRLLQRLNGLQDHLAQLRALANQALPLVPMLVEQQRARFLERWQEAMGHNTRVWPNSMRTEPSAWMV